MGFRNRLNFPPGSITDAMLADGSVTGPKLSFDAIDGKTITGAKIRTAAPPDLRWEMTSDSANLLRAFSGDVDETAPGGVEVGNSGSPGSVSVLAPEFANVAPASLILRQIDAGGTSEVVLSSRSGGGTLEDSATPGNNLNWFGGRFYRDQTWTDLTLQNSWVDFGSASFQKPGYIKHADGTVELCGFVKNGSSATAVIATLPTGYRPVRKAVISGAAAGHAQVSISNDSLCRMFVSPSGAVNVTIGGSTLWVSLYGIRFATF